MGRELKRKEERKNKKTNTNNVELDTSIKMMTLLKLIFFVVLMLVVVYYVVAIFVTKELDFTTSNNDATENATNNVVSDKILASNIFNQKDSTYYVYFYDFSNNKVNDDLSSLITSSIDEKIYKVDTSSGLNSKYVTDDTGNKKATSINDLKVVSNTLIKIENDKIKEYYEGKNNIMNALKS